jgi:hypothetical protein
MHAQTTGYVRSAEEHTAIENIWRLISPFEPLMYATIIVKASIHYTCARN